MELAGKYVGELQLMLDLLQGNELDMHEEGDRNGLRPLLVELLHL